MRRAVVDRRTAETKILVRLKIDGTGKHDIETGIRFFDHMLQLVARHGGFDLSIKAKGDLDVDQHHTVEDVGISLGEAISGALGTRRGINRAGYFVMPMDETLGVAAIDLSGRIHSVVDLKLAVERVGDLQTELVQDFFEGFAQGARANVHVKVLYGRSSHHQIEALFKAFARALRVACARDRRLLKVLPSTKELLEVGRIALIDYRAGNLTSVRKGLHAVGACVFTPSAPDELSEAQALIVPGVGHIGSTTALSDGWRRSISEAIDRRTPLLGICLGLQWLFESSEEAPEVAGLAVISGRCGRLPSSVKVPHVGWNALEIIQPSTLLAEVPDGTQVYFTHSYAAPVTGETVAVTTHGARFSAVVERDRVFGVQFHPEKSGEAGLQVLRNFVRLAGG